MSKPFIQVNDETREMTDDEYAIYLLVSEKPFPNIDPIETPTP